MTDHWHGAASDARWIDDAGRTPYPGYDDDDRPTAADLADEYSKPGGRRMTWVDDGAPFPEHLFRGLR